MNTSAQGIPEPRIARMLQAKVARPQWGRAPPRSALRGCRRRQWPEHLTSGRLGTQSCEDVSGKSAQTTMGQGTSHVRVVRISQAKVVRPPRLRASRNPELRGCLRRQVAGPQGISEPRDARMPQAKVARSPQVKASGIPECRGCLTRNGPELFEKHVLVLGVVRMSEARVTR